MRFRILGPLEVRAGQDWYPIKAAKRRVLLAALLLSPDQVVSADRLMAELWGDDLPGSAANSISVYVFRLRRLLGDPAGEILMTRAPGYQLRCGPGDLDAQVFEDQAARGRQLLTAGQPQQAALALTRALSLWRGTVLSDVPRSARVAAEADRLEEARLAALELRIEADLRRGQDDELVPELRKLAAGHPLREGIWALLLQALEGAGRNAEAVTAYGQARQLIAAELGTEPGPRLQALFQRLLAARPPAPHAGPPARHAGPPAPGAGSRPAAPAGTAGANAAPGPAAKGRPGGSDWHGPSGQTGWSGAGARRGRACSAACRRPGLHRPH